MVRQRPRAFTAAAEVSRASLRRYRPTTVTWAHVYVRLWSRPCEHCARVCEIACVAREEWCMVLPVNCMRCRMPGKWDPRSQHSPPKPQRRQTPPPPMARRQQPPPAIEEDKISPPPMMEAPFSALELSSAKQVSVIRGPGGSVGFKLRYTPLDSFSLALTAYTLCTLMPKNRGFVKNMG